MDVTRLFAQRPGERLTLRDVAEHTVGSLEEIRELLEELVDMGWLSIGKNADHRVIYWKEEVAVGG